MTTYKVSAVKPSGKDDPKFGVEYYVKLDNDDVARLWFKKEPVVGQELDLEKGDKGYKKVKKEWNPSNPSSTSSTTPSKPFQKSSTFKDNSVGMRIGMCVNNAANYVNSLNIEKDGAPHTLSPADWATTVASYAIELFHNTDDTNFTEEKKPVIEGEHIVLDENPFL